MNILLGIFLLISSHAWASVRDDVNQGNQSFKKGDYNQAVEYYQKALHQQPDSDIVNYNLGTALYKLNQYEQAVQPLLQASVSKDKTIAKDSFYNLGNSLYKFGLSQEEGNIDAAINGVKRSVSSYDQGLKLDKKDKDIRINREKAEKYLELLNKKKKEQKRKGQGQQKNQSEDGSPQQEKSDSQGDQQKQDSSDKKEEEQAGKQQEKSGQEKQGQEQQAGTEPADEKDLNKKEAQEVLEDYQRNEEPKGLLHFIEHKSKENPVLKDW